MSEAHVYDLVDYMFDTRQRGGVPINQRPSFATTVDPDEEPVVITDPVSFVHGALDYEAVLLANMPEQSGRNQQLNKSAWKLGRLAGAGLLTQEQAETVLFTACEVNGLLAEDGVHQCRKSFDSGWNKGVSNPRPVQIVEVEKAPPFVPPPGVTVPLTTTTVTPEQAQAALLEREVFQGRVRRLAKMLLDAEEAAASFRVPPSRCSLVDELAIPEEEVTYAVEKVLPTGANALLTASFKTGKTTLIGDLARAHADGAQFLDQFDVAPSDGRLAIFNYELSDGQYRRWLRELGIVNQDRVTVLHLRGFRLPVIVPLVEDWVVQWLTERQVTRWVVDPFARAFTGCGNENDNGEVGRFLDTLDVIKARAGVSELVLPTHTGRAVMEQGQERARGATRLDDWADVRWMLNKDDEDVRYFAATGRDVDLDEEKLTYDEKRRALHFGGPSRSMAKTANADDRVLQIVKQRPGISLKDLREESGLRSNKADEAAKRLAGRRLISVRKEARETRHYPAGAAPFVYEGGDSDA